MKMVYFIPMGIFIALSALLLFGLSNDPRRVPSPLINKPVPTFSLSTVEDQNKIFSSKELTGQVALVNIWASWCRSCRAEHAILERLAGKGIPIYGINYKDNLADAKNWLQRYGNPYRKSAYDVQGKIGIEWGAYGTPETFIIDTQGIIRYKHIGPISKEDMDNIILPVIARLRTL